VEGVDSSKQTLHKVRRDDGGDDCLRPTAVSVSCVEGVESVEGLGYIHPGFKKENTATPFWGNIFFTAKYLKNPPTLHTDKTT
jgi:hypothetical protein